jgi:hypothetical protein
MMGGGAVRGWLLDKDDDYAALAGGLEKLAEAAAAAYGGELPSPGKPAPAAEPFLFAAGDGNHSLASAKGVWDEYKAAGDPALANHPARYILVEIENLYDPALAFEPIHRFVFGVKPDEIAALFPGCTRSGGIVSVPYGAEKVQPALDDFVKTRPGLTIDYIHGEEELRRLAARSEAGGASSAGAGILLPPFNRHGLFRIAAERGALPRKSFSMGEAVEKRYYLEGRRLFG